MLLQANNMVHYFPYDYYICQMHHVFWLMAHFSSVQTVKWTTVPFNRWWLYLAWITTRTDCHFAQMHMFWRWEWYLFDMHLHLVCMTFMVTLNFLLSIVQHLFSIELPLYTFRPVLKIWYVQNRYNKNIEPTNKQGSLSC